MGTFTVDRGIVKTKKETPRQNDNKVKRSLEENRLREAGVKDKCAFVSPLVQNLNQTLQLFCFVLCLFFHFIASHFAASSSV